MLSAPHLKQVVLPFGCSCVCAIEQDNGPSVGFAVAGGILLFLGNLGTQYALAFTGLSITEVVASSLTVVGGTTINYFLVGTVMRADSFTQSHLIVQLCEHADKCVCVCHRSEGRCIPGDMSPPIDSGKNSVMTLFRAWPELLLCSSHGCKLVCFAPWLDMLPPFSCRFKA